MIVVNRDKREQTGDGLEAEAEAAVDCEISLA